ncbi:unnamed protein product [Leptidea sinapis]|uniref:VWFA domain-containing protein n=1 Tax=Leptidea sinapis TaxID=189913 RepID=A0A5E4QVL8_9NEOP|nr:unnamed protein product [Leptidea sinapis]
MPNQKAAKALVDLLERRGKAAEAIMRKAEELATNVLETKIAAPTDYTFDDSIDLDVLKKVVPTESEWEMSSGCRSINKVKLQKSSHFNAEVSLETTSVHVVAEVFACAASWKSLYNIKVEVEDVFDCRLRPWYVSASGAPRDVLILLDASGSMSNSSNQVTAEQFTQTLLNALTDDDQTNVLRFNVVVESPISCFNDRLVPDPRRGEYHWREMENAEQAYRYRELRRNKQRLLSNLNKDFMHMYYLVNIRIGSLMGASGSLFLVDHRGNIVLHDNTKPMFNGDILRPGYRTVDFLDVEQPGVDHYARHYPQEWLDFRNSVVINKTSGSKAMYAKTIFDGGLRCIIEVRDYFWQRIHNHYTLVVSLPKYNILHAVPDGEFTQKLGEEALSALSSGTDFAVHPDWLYCRHVEPHFDNRELEVLHFLRRRRDEPNFPMYKLKHLFSPIPPTLLEKTYQ